jgi:hypothetical protein
MAKRKVVTPSHRTVLQRGIQTAGDYMRLAQTLIWDVSNKLVPVEYAQRLIRFSVLGWSEARAPSPRAR